VFEGTDVHTCQGGEAGGLAVHTEGGQVAVRVSASLFEANTGGGAGHVLVDVEG